MTNRSHPAVAIKTHIRHIQIVANNIQLMVQPLPQYDQFEHWARTTLSSLIDHLHMTAEQNQTQHHTMNQDLLKIAEQIDSGADRHLLRFTFNQQQFSLNFENYSNSIWISPEEPAAEHLLKQLLALVTVIYTQSHWKAARQQVSEAP